MKALTKPTRYRWLELGQTYRYQPAKGKALDERRGTLCTVLILPRSGAKPANVLVEFEDGVKVVTSSMVLRKVVS